jgi:ubiquinone/menaquinone biosynthesis C-methylase UbiE
VGGAPGLCRGGLGSGSEVALRELGPRPGDTVLELAAGVGDTGFEAATLGEGGRLISTDFSPAMVEAARRRGYERGAENVEYRVMDAERIELDGDSVDGVLPLRVHADGRPGRRAR